MNRASNGFAKILLVFFAVLFAAVLVHPDVDLLDVHDVKISNAHSQIRCVDGGVVSQVPVASCRPQQEQPYRLECLRNTHEAALPAIRTRLASSEFSSLQRSLSFGSPMP